MDINIIVDFIEPSRRKNKIAIQLLEYLTANSYQICISEDMLSTVFYIVKDKSLVLKFFKVIQKKWNIVHFGADVIKNAIDISSEKNLDLEDVLQCLCAKENGCVALITNDKKFYDCGLATYTTEEYLKILFTNDCKLKND